MLRHRNLPLLLLQARESVLSRFRPIMKAHGITEQQWRITRLLLDVGPLEPREITRCCGISSPSLVGVLARMAQDGLIARERFADDKRRLMIRPAQRAFVLAASMLPEINATYRDLQRALGKRFYQKLVGSLDQLICAMEQAKP
jgi:homoprotocatechuate degradation regulator HpaR